MTRLPLVVLVAFVAASALVPVCRALAQRAGILDVPKAHKRHPHPIPLLGGLAIYLAVMSSTLVTLEKPFHSARFPSILVGGTVVFLLGLWDDRRGLHARWKLLGQLAAAGGMVAAGVTTHLFGAHALDVALTVFWVVGLTNAFNFMDNMDGLCSGVGAVAAASFLLWAIDNGQYHVASLCCALLGATAGFLAYNFNPASIFMGDAGSLFIGFVLAALGTDLRYPSRAPFIHWTAPIVVLGLPIFDTVLVTVSRLRRRAPVWVGARDHLSHRLLRRGLTVRRTALVLYLAGAALGGAAFVITRLGSPFAYALVGALGAAGAAALVWLERTGRPSQAGASALPAAAPPGTAAQDD